MLSGIFRRHFNWINVGLLLIGPCRLQNGGHLPRSQCIKWDLIGNTLNNPHPHWHPHPRLSAALIFITQHLQFAWLVSITIEIRVYLMPCIVGWHGNWELNACLLQRVHELKSRVIAILHLAIRVTIAKRYEIKSNWLCDKHWLA